MTISLFRSLPNFTALLFLWVLSTSLPAVADGVLFVEQIGERHSADVSQIGSVQRAGVLQGEAGTRDNRAMVSQGSVPNAPDAAAFLGLDPNEALFTVYDADDLTDAPSWEDATVTDLLGELDVTGAGPGNTAELIQTGSRNRALAVQMGANNRMLTEQHGDGNIAVHLQEGSGNDTELVQRNGGNINALLAEGGAVGNDGGPLRLEAMGDVQGFSIRATGVQSYATATVERNGTGGLNITLQPR